MKVFLCLLPLVTKVDPGCPAVGVLEAGDLILGVHGEYFSGDARKGLGRAIDEAESEESAGQLKLIRWRPVAGAEPRQGKEEAVVVKLPALGSYAETAPYHCPKTERILAQAVAHLLEQKPCHGGRICPAGHSRIFHQDRHGPEQCGHVGARVRLEDHERR